jgi:hypothetical protein
MTSDVVTSSSYDTFSILCPQWLQNSEVSLTSLQLGQTDFTGVPHSAQNLAFGLSLALQLPQVFIHYLLIRKQISR